MGAKYSDPVAKPDATITSLTLMPVTAADRAKARLKVATMAKSPDDLGRLLDLLGLGDRDEIAAQLGRRP